MCKQRIATVEDMRDSVSLVFSQGNLRVDAHKGDVGTIKLTGTGGVETLVVLLYQRMATVRITPHPIPESILDGLLLLLGKGRLLLVQYTLFLAFFIQHNVIDAGVTQVQGVLQNAVGVGSVRAEGGVGCNIGTGDRGLAGDVPFGGVGREMHLNLPLQVVRGAEGFVHELLDVVLVYPCCTQTDVDLRGVQILGLSRCQGFHIGNEPGVTLCHQTGIAKLLPYIAGKVLIGCHILQGLACSHGFRQREDHAGQFLGKFIFGLAGQLRHERKIHTLSDGDGQCFHSSIHMLDNLLLLDGALGEHICFPLELLLIVQNLQRTQEVIGRIIGEGQRVATGIDEAILRCEGVVPLIQLRLQPLNGAVSGFVHLGVNESVNAVTQPHKPLDTLLGCLVEVRANHDGVLAVIHLSVHNGVGVVLHAGVSRDGFTDFLTLCQLRQGRCHIRPVDALHGVAEFIGKGCASRGADGISRLTILCAF